MITCSSKDVESGKTSPQPSSQKNWKQIFSEAVCSPQELLDLLELPHTLLEGALRGTQLFPMRVPMPYIERMNKKDPADPLLIQVLPIRAESIADAGFSADPLAEREYNPAEGIIHKYHGRVLLIATGACAVNCRFCFRRHFPYEENRLTRHWPQALEYIRQRREIREVILSGGDPLVLTDTLLMKLASELAAIPHLETLRIHTRLPIVIPQRVTDQMTQWLSDCRLNKVMVLHTNHANEIDDSVTEALSRLRSADVTLLNQSVLLRGVNDTVESLQQLSDKLFRMGVLPYYLHLPDKVSGTAHFFVEESTGQSLLRELSAISPGYLVPKLVREEPGKRNKTAIPLDSVENTLIAKQH